MTKQERALKDSIGDLGFGVWVRCYPGGFAWAGAINANQEKSDALVRRLTTLGHAAKLKDRVGAHGPWIIGVELKA